MGEFFVSLKNSIRSVVKNSSFLSNCYRKIQNQPSPFNIDKVVESELEPTSLQGCNRDKISVRTDSINWRAHFSNQLNGEGLEIGPLHRPMITHSGMNMKYVDRCTVADLREHYPELKDLPLVEPHILDDAEVLKTVANESFDFLISAHVIEHMKNPLFALEQWARVLKPGGLIYMIVPDKRVTFDKKRVRTNTAHIVLDYKQPSAERDYEHYLDYAVHVHGKTQPSEALIEADRLLEIDYSIHYHVFIPEDVVALLEWFSNNIRTIEILEGPCRSEGSDEFHFLIKVPAIQ